MQKRTTHSPPHQEKIPSKRIIRIGRICRWSQSTKKGAMLMEGWRCASRDLFVGFLSWLESRGVEGGRRIWSPTTIGANIFNTFAVKENKICFWLLTLSSSLFFVLWFAQLYARILVKNDAFDLEYNSEKMGQICGQFGDWAILRNDLLPWYDSCEGWGA